MPRSLISHLPRGKQDELLDDLNYLNTTEIKAFCKKHSIPYAIVFAKPDGTRKKTGEHDRKGVMLDRIRHFLTTGGVLPETCFPASVVRFEAQHENLAASHRLFYGQYDKGNRAVMAALKDLTDGRFKDGAIARILLREFWSSGKAPALEAYAEAWRRAIREHKRPNPEWAFLTDRTNRRANADWKQLRAGKATKVLKILNQL